MLNNSQLFTYAGKADQVRNQSVQLYLYFTLLYLFNIWLKELFSNTFLLLTTLVPAFFLDSRKIQELWCWILSKTPNIFFSPQFLPWKNVVLVPNPSLWADLKPWDLSFVPTYETYDLKERRFLDMKINRMK